MVPKWVEIAPQKEVPDVGRACPDAFARAILEGGDSPCPGEQGRRRLEIIRGAYHPMKRGGPVEFPVKE